MVRFAHDPRRFSFNGLWKKGISFIRKKLIEREFQNVRLGVLKGNEKAKDFWISQGFNFFGKSDWEGKEVSCFEKRL